MIGDRLALQAGRLLAKFFLVTTLGAIAVIHMPYLPLRVQVVGHWWGNLTGQDQRWSQFAADPRAISIDLWAELVYSDGERTRWTLRREGPFGDIAYYHWVKWAESVVLESHPDQINGLADWLAGSSTRSVSSMRIVAWSRAGLAPGEVPPEPQIRVLFQSASSRIEPESRTVP